MRLHEAISNAIVAVLDATDDFDLREAVVESLQIRQRCAALAAATAYVGAIYPHAGLLDDDVLAQAEVFLAWLSKP